VSGTYGSQTSPPFFGGFCQTHTQIFQTRQILLYRNFSQGPLHYTPQGGIVASAPEPSAVSLISVCLKYLCMILTECIIGNLPCRAEGAAIAGMLGCHSKYFVWVLTEYFVEISYNYLLICPSRVFYRIFDRIHYRKS
jgi:hypothetical protein